MYKQLIYFLFIMITVLLSNFSTASEETVEIKALEMEISLAIGATQILLSDSCGSIDTVVAVRNNLSLILTKGVELGKFSEQKVNELFEKSSLFVGGQDYRNKAHAAEMCDDARLIVKQLNDLAKSP